METKVTTSVTKGIIITLILIVYGLILYFSNQIGNQWLGYFQQVIFLAGIIWSCVTFSKQMDANVTFGNLFAHGFKVAAAVIALLSVYTAIAMKFLFPDMVDKGVEIARQKMQQSGKLSDSQITQQLDFYRAHALLFTLASLIIFMAIIGAVAALIGAAVAKKKPQDPFANQPI